MEIGEDGVEEIKTAEPLLAGAPVNQWQKEYLYLSGKNQRERKWKSICFLSFCP